VRRPPRSPAISARPEATAAALTLDGWLRTGDAGTLDAEGFLHVLDRRDDLLVSAGENVVPAEVEAAIEAHPAIAEAGVVGRPDLTWGAVPVAAVVLRPGVPTPSHRGAARVLPRAAGAVQGAGDVRCRRPRSRARCPASSGARSCGRSWSERSGAGARVWTTPRTRPAHERCVGAHVRVRRRRAAYVSCVQRGARGRARGAHRPPPRDALRVRPAGRLGRLLAAAARCSCSIGGEAGQPAAGAAAARRRGSMSPTSARSWITKG